MKNWLIAVALINLSFGASRPEAWLSKHERNLDELASAPVETKVATFSPVLSSIGDLKEFNRWNEREKSLYYNAQKLLITTPGHAYQIREGILKIQDTLLGKYPGKSAATSDYFYATSALLHLPSFETIQMLSEFLDEIPDEQKYWDKSPSSTEYALFAPWAARIITDMLDDPPEVGKFDKDGWLAWREEVQSGKRTFRFKEGKVDYNFDGPVESNRVAIVRENRSDTASGHSTPAPASSVSNKTGGTSSHNIDEVPRWIYFALTALILAVLGWQFRARIKKS